LDSLARAKKLGVRGDGAEEEEDEFDRLMRQESKLFIDEMLWSEFKAGKLSSPPPPDRPKSSARTPRR
jgi:hypothetical protein